MLSTTITFIISIIIFYLTLISLDKKSTKNYKHEIVSLGVFGTFLGIAIGLYNFDVTDIKNSMPILLGGLKTAFVTSGIGIFASIMISIVKPVQKDKNEIVSALEVVVKEFNKNLTTQFGENFRQLNEAVKELVIWQKNYKNQIQDSQKAFNNILNQLNKLEIAKEEEQKRIKKLIENLDFASKSIKSSLEESTQIVKEQMQLLLREANRRL